VALDVVMTAQQRNSIVTAIQYDKGDQLRNHLSLIPPRLEQIKIMITPNKPTPHCIISGKDAGFETPTTPGIPA